MTPSELDAEIDQTLIDALGSLGNRHRLTILLTLADSGGSEQDHLQTMSFTEIYEASTLDSSSQFTYHLNQLVGPFICETSSGYRLTYTGRKLVRAILSGAYESTSSFEARSVSGVCIVCEKRSLEAAMEHELLTVRCRSCATTQTTVPFPRSLTRERTPSEIIDSIGYHIWGEYVHLRGGVCPECYGRVETTVAAHDLEDRTEYTLTNACRDCQLVLRVPIVVAVLFHPVALYVFWQSDVSILDVPLWGLHEYIVSDVITTEIISQEPFKATFTLNINQENYRFRMDESLSVSPIADTSP